VRLFNAQNFTDRRLSETALLYDLVDLQRQVGFQQFPLRVRKSEIGEYVAAALCLRRFGLRRVSSTFRGGRRNAGLRFI
jgi:hypothetical protein